MREGSVAAGSDEDVWELEFDGSFGDEGSSDELGSCWQAQITNSNISNTARINSFFIGTGSLLRLLEVCRFNGYIKFIMCIMIRAVTFSETTV
jgi:hypothetical protein